VTPSSPEISVVVPVFNSERTSRKCRTSLTQQEGVDYEIIIMDDGSIDRTLEICRSFKDVTSIALENGGPSRARNQGTRMARGQFIAFTDGDCIVDRRWLAELREGFIGPYVAGVGGGQISPHDETPKGRTIQDFLKIIGFMGDYVKADSFMKETEHNPSCNVMYRKCVLEEVGGFEDGLWPGEDVELDLRIIKARYKLVFNPKSLVQHYRPSTYRAYGRMMKRYGAAQRYLVKKYGFFRRIHYVPVALMIVLFLLAAFLYLNPHLSLMIPLVMVVPFAFFFAKTNKFTRSIIYMMLLAVTLVCWNWGFVAGRGNESSGKVRVGFRSQ
jgi:glycosyltransferase involved in cell wall biosynthesis